MTGENGRPRPDEAATQQIPTTVEKLRGLPWGVAWSVTNSIFVRYTFFGSIFVLFLNQLNLEKGQIGVLLSLLPFFGVLAVFIAPTVARLGYKRVFVGSMAARTATGFLLLVSPLVLVQFGQEAVLAFIVFTVAAFGLFRATGFTAFYPWQQELVPGTMRGKYTAVKNTLSSLSALIATMAAGYVLGSDPDLARFMLPIGVGVLFGAVSVWTATRQPGGAPISRDTAGHSSYVEMVAAARNRSFASYLAGIGLVTLATVPLTSFVPLFMQEEVGLSPGQVVWLETAVLLGGLASSYVWGWLADRYGSKPVMVSGVLLLSLPPLAWLLMPRAVPASVPIALSISLALGIVDTGWVIGSGRILYVRMVPMEKRSPYMAVYYAWMGIAGGLGLLIGGWLVDLAANVGGQWWVFSLDPYTILFVIGIAFPLLAYLLFRSVEADSAVTTRQFAGLFVRGNPLLAIQSMVGFHRARDEEAAVEMTERLGTTRSPLTDEELLEALHDPRFLVRFEAIVAIARHGSGPNLTEALIETLGGDDPALSTISAWALGRIGDEHALEALRGGLQARYRSVQAHSARSLATLEDGTIRPVLLARLEQEEDAGLQLAFASALGKLGATEAIEPLLGLLEMRTSPIDRVELALALARLTGEEHPFIQLQRRIASEPGTALSQAVTTLKDRLSKAHMTTPETAKVLDRAAEALAEDDLAQGIGLLAGELDALPPGVLGKPRASVLRACIDHMTHFGSERLEYVQLALHTVDSWISE
jgi:MFS family permease/HEAT repeat protein